MTTAGPVARATNRLARFNADRDHILAEVKRRIMEQCLARAARGGDDSLEYLLNEVVFSEVNRLETPSTRSEQRQLQRWKELSNRLLRMSDTEKRSALESLVDHYCQDIVGNFDLQVYHFAKDVVPSALSLLLSPVRSIREGIAAVASGGNQVLAEGPIDMIRSLGESGTLVFAPTHSSNMDSLVLALGLVKSELPPVTYGAGKNLFTNVFISYFMRNLGAYRVDRRLRFRLYKDVLKEYSTVLLENGYHSLFFPGGTRSRSNRIEEHLKLGLLGTSLAAFRNRARAGHRDSRIYIIPVTINYRLVLEAETLIDDYLAETGKSRYIIQDDEFSRLGRLVEFARKALVHEGSVIVRYGEPLDPMGNRVAPDGMSLDHRGRSIDPVTYLLDQAGAVSDDNQRDEEYIRIVGKTLVDAYRREAVFLSTHLVARVLFDDIASRVGTRDIYRLLRASPEVCAVPLARARLGIDRLRARLDAEPHLGRVSASMAAQSADEVLADALRALVTYHTHPVTVRRGDDIQVQSMKLLYYYQNRLYHVPAGGEA